ncbi:hypothetical protein PI124_g7527 [Phytophthora idaei]|nr:hypothetical protein PI124_g7527 [Phytophthora idaei]
MPRVFKSLLHLKFGLRNKLTNADLRVRYHAGDHAQTLDWYLGRPADAGAGAAEEAGEEDAEQPDPDEEACGGGGCPASGAGTSELPWSGGRVFE